MAIKTPKAVKSKPVVQTAETKQESAEDFVKKIKEKYPSVPKYSIVYNDEKYVTENIDQFLDVVKQCILLYITNKSYDDETNELIMTTPQGTIYFQ